MLVITYPVMAMDWNPWFKFATILLGMFGITWLLYEWVIRRINVLRLSFGMKTRVRALATYDDPLPVAADS